MTSMPSLKKDLREVYWAPNRAAAEVAHRRLRREIPRQVPPAVECLAKDRDALLAFYDSLPSMRITCRTDQTPSRACSRPWRTGPGADERITVVNDSQADGVQARACRIQNLAARSKAQISCPKVIAGVRFNDGIEVIQMPANHAA